MPPKSENKSRDLFSANFAPQLIATIGDIFRPENISKRTISPRPKIEFEYGEPVTLTLRYAQGLEVESKYYERWPGDTTQYVFSAEEGTFYVSETAGALLNARLRSLGVDAGETITITKLRVPNHAALRPVTEFFAEVR